jgi:hypothetical protein
MICLFYSFRISFDQNGFHANPKHLVGHSYVIFEGDRYPPVVLYFRYFRWNWVYFGNVSLFSFSVIFVLFSITTSAIVFFSCEETLRCDSYITYIG